MQGLPYRGPKSQHNRVFCQYLRRCPYQKTFKNQYLLIVYLDQKSWPGEHRPCKEADFKCPI